jgi:hypothetical protein
MHQTVICIWGNLEPYCMWVPTSLHMLNDVAGGLQLRMPLRLQIQQLLQPLVNHLPQETQQKYSDPQT